MTESAHHYLCPNCDEWILDDDWDAHAVVCTASKPLHLMSPDEIYKEVNRRQHTNPRWHQQWRDIGRAAEEVGTRYVQQVTYHLDFRMPIHYSVTPYQRPTAGYIPPVSQELHTIAVSLPPGLTQSEAEALAFEQLMEQLPDD